MPMRKYAKKYSDASLLPVSFVLFALVHRFEKASRAAVYFHTLGQAVAKEPAVVGVDPKQKKRRGKSKPAASSTEANPGSD